MDHELIVPSSPPHGSVTIRLHAPFGVENKLVQAVTFDKLGARPTPDAASAANVPVYGTVPV